MTFATFDVLGVIQVGPVSDIPLRVLEAPILARFPWFTVTELAAVAIPDDAYDSQRDQYRSTRILALLEKQIKVLKVDRVLGVTPFDLFVPGMNFVFGEAGLPGRVGVVSTHRLKPSSLNRSSLFHERVIKEAIHEIGHMLGLSHCTDVACVMRFSENITDTDRKGAEFCRKCQSRLVKPQLE